MKHIPRIGVAAAVAISAGLIGAAVAQDQSSQNWWAGWMMTWGQRGMMGSGGMGPWMMGGSPEKMCRAMASHVEGRLAYIKAEFKITEAQGLLCNAYAAAARDNANYMAAHCTSMMSGRGGPSTASLPDRLDQHEQFMAAQVEAVRAMNKALEPLYAALSDSQKKAADQLFRAPMGMM